MLSLYRLHTQPRSSLDHHAIGGSHYRRSCVSHFAQGATTSSDWSRGHAWAMYGYTAVQRYLRGGSACAEQYNAANPGVVDSLLALAVNVSESFLQMLPTQLQVRCTLCSQAHWAHA